jgi:nitroimidazol reductase NimA-like FMN-containing flavoprotein (pyridoxamine 5'-phosphate oxidase superfamily)
MKRLIIFKLYRMLGTLSESQITNLLTMQAIGRLGYHDDRRTYITPVTYAFDGKYIYGQTNEGLKLNIMRENPQVCFEVDVMMDMGNWQSVILWGLFEELQDQEAETGRAFLYNSVLDLMTAASVHLHEHGSNNGTDESNRIKQVAFRILVTEKMGRFERQQPK